MVTSIYRDNYDYQRKYELFMLKKILHCKSHYNQKAASEADNFHGILRVLRL
jgi:hypothetical protein